MHYGMKENCIHMYWCHNIYASILCIPRWLTITFAGELTRKRALVITNWLRFERRIRYNENVAAEEKRVDKIGWLNEREPIRLIVVILLLSF